MGMIFLSDEDTDVRGLVSAWMNKQPSEDVREVLPKYIDQYFFKAVDWCQKTNDFVVETSLVGCVLNGLSHMHGVSNRLEFAVALIRGLGGNLKESSNAAFAQEVYKWVGENPPGRNPTAIYYNKERDRVDVYGSDVESNLNLSSFSDDGFPLVRTASIKSTLDCLMSWLDPQSSQPFLLLGPEGCGKSLLLHSCFKKLRATNVAVVHCSAHITPQHVIQKLSQVCLVVSSSNGRVFRPKECDRLILYLKDLNLASPDKYGTCMLIAFLQQILTYGGFYDNNLEWVGLEAVQIVGSMTAGTGLGRHQLSTRFTSILRLHSISQPDKDYLEVVYSSYLGAVFRSTLPSHPTWSSESRVAQLASSMVQVFQQMKQSFSVDDQSHYLFTPKHLTDWCLGLVRYTMPEGDKNSAGVLQAWAYEACRIFRDKLAGDEDITKFDNILRSALQSDWNSNASDKVHDEFFVTPADTAYSPGGPMPKFGRQLAQLSKGDWENIVDGGILHFARENRDLDVVIIDELLELVARCDRVLSMPGGSLLMPGRSGVGRRTAVSIVSALHQAKLNTLKVGRNYGEKQFKMELKTAMHSAGVDGEQVFLLLEDHNFGDPAFLDMINSLLSSGEVPGLYSPEELEPLMTPMREKASNAGYSGNLFSFFARCVKKNLHVILIMDFTNPSFVANCESNPALYKECQVVWMEKWAETSMVKLPLLVLTKEERVEGADIGAKKDKKSEKKRRVSGGDELLQSFYKIHSSIKKSEDSTPKKYVTFIKTYKNVYSREKLQITSRQEKLTKGVSKLTEARDVVTKLKKEAAIQEKELDQKQAEANDALQMITDTMKDANTQKVEMEDLKGRTLTEEKALNLRKVDIERELEEVQPLIEEAKKAVGSIKSSTLAEVRSLRMPPEVIRDILEGVLCLMGIQDTSWNSMKQFLAKRGIKDEILSFDARKVDPRNRVTVEKLLKERSNSFEPAAAKRASGAAAPLAAWVMANVKFSYVLEKVRPLEQEQSKLQRNLKMAEDSIGKLSSGLDQVDQQVGVLKERLNKFTREAAGIEIHLNKTKETIAAADSLVEGLQGEFERWNNEVKNMSGDLEKIPQFSLLGSAFLVYLSNAPEDERKKSMDKWQGMLGIKRFDVTHFLASERDILQWRSEGLPSDNLSVENAMCILQSMLR
jgi:dynein heavy chain 2